MVAALLDALGELAQLVGWLASAPSVPTFEFRNYLCSVGDLSVVSRVDSQLHAPDLVAPDLTTV